MFWRNVIRFYPRWLVRTYNAGLSLLCSCCSCCSCGHINQNTAFSTNFTMLSVYWPGSLARPCPAALPGLARQPCPAAFPGSLVRQPCPATLPGSLARQPCPTALPGSISRQHCTAALPGSIARQHCPAAILCDFEPCVRELKWFSVLFNFLTLNTVKEVVAMLGRLKPRGCGWKLCPRKWGA
jgi:hypothetical protein